MKKNLLLVLLLLLPVVASAHDFEVDGIYYLKNGDKATVTFKGEHTASYFNEYSGQVAIPNVVTYNGTTYSVTSIGEDAFSYCNSLTSISIPASITSIGEDAFYSCYNLENVNIDSIDFWYKISFGNQYSNPIYYAHHLLLSGTELTELVVPNSVSSIHSFAFYNYSELKSISIPSSVTSIGRNSFFGCSGLTCVNISDIAAWCKTTFIDNPLKSAHHLYLNDSELTDLIIPNTVTYISGSAFDGCTGLKSVSIPNSVTSIGSSAFYGCTGLKSVSIPNSVTSIGSSAFYGCTELESVNIPDALTKISDYTFYNCRSLTSVSIGSSVTLIDYHAFTNCNGLTSIDIPNSVTRIGTNAFWGCSGATTASIGNSVTYIGESAFKDCVSLDTLYFNADSCADFNLAISTHPFYNLNISSIVFGESVRRIPAYFAYNLTQLTSVSIPNSIISIGQNAFPCCSGLTSITVANDNPVYDSRGNCNAIIETTTNTLISGCQNTLIPNSVTAIGSSAFYGCSELTSITIPNSVITVGNSSFSRCRGLENVIIPNSVTTIGQYAFSYCSGLTSINIGNSVTAIGWYAFDDCSNLVNVTCCATTPPTIENSYTFPSTVTSQSTLIVPTGTKGAYEVAEYWKDFSNIVEGIIIFADDSVKALCVQNWDTNGDCELSVEEAVAVTSITEVFSSNSAITSFDEFQYFTGLTTTGYRAFLGCSSLTSITIPSSIYLIGSYAFYGCSSLSSITIPHTVTQINYEAFGNCAGLTGITIPNSVDTIGVRAFRGCSGLTSIIVEAGNPTYDSRDDCNAIIETASNTLIAGCINTVIPTSVTAIEGYSFWGRDQLTSITIPCNVTSIGSYAFYNCSGLISVTCFAQTPPVIADTYTFSSAVTNQATLYVPKGTKSAYLAADYWKTFLNIVEIDILATSISLDVTEAELLEEGTLQLTATVLPEETIDKSVTWTSSNEDVATVDDNGLVTACGLGTATITATTCDGSDLSASCEVTVNDKYSNNYNYFSIDDTTVLCGDTIIVPVSMTNAANIISFQTDIFLPEGLELLQEDGEYLIGVSDRMTNSHVINGNAVSNGAIRILCYSSNYKAFTGNSGDDLFYITVKVADDADGDYTISLKNTMFTTTEFDEIAVCNTSANISVIPYLLGDANGSRRVTVTDVVVTSKYVLEKNPNPFFFVNADVNADGNITVTDVSRIAYLAMNADLNLLKRMPALAISNDHMTGEGITLTIGETRTMSIILDNSLDYTAFQMDLNLPDGLTADNFAMTDRAGNSHTFDVNELRNGNLRILCYSPTIEAIGDNSGALLTFDVTATDEDDIHGSIIVDGIEFVTTNCQTVILDSFVITVNGATSFNEMSSTKSITRVDYYNLAGQRIEHPENGVTVMVTTYNDGTRDTIKFIR